MNNIAIVTGAQGRLGKAFAKRLEADGFAVERLDMGDPPHRAAAPGDRLYLFDFAYTHEQPWHHVDRVAAHLADWRRYVAIFVPSSLWIGPDDDYGRAKMAVMELVARYRAEGAHVVTDPIGYFPGDGVAACAGEPLLAHLVTGDALYARVMAAMCPAEAVAA